MAYTYSAYGLGLSTNFPLAALNLLPSTSPIDVHICFGAFPSWFRKVRNASVTTIYKSNYSVDSNEANLQVHKFSGINLFRFLYRDGTTVLVNQEGTQIWVEGPQSANIEDTATYILGPILGFLLRLRGSVCLHASAVNVDGQAITFLGSPGAGKSTTAAGFAKLGFPVLTDDVTALSEHGYRFMVQPGYPRLNLWQDSSEALFGPEDTLAFITPTWEKLYLDLNGDGYQFQQEPLPLSAIYILGDRSSDSSAPSIEPVSPAASLITLVANTSTNYLLDTTMRKQEFESLSRLVDQVHIRRVTPHADPALLTELCKQILDDIRTLNAAKLESSYV